MSGRWCLNVPWRGTASANRLGKAGDLLANINDPVLAQGLRRIAN